MTTDGPATTYLFKPPFDISTRKGLLRLLERYDRQGLGGIFMEDLQESLPRCEKIINILLDQDRIIGKVVLYNHFWFFCVAIIQSNYFNGKTSLIPLLYCSDQPGSRQEKGCVSSRHLWENAVQSKRRVSETLEVSKNGIYKWVTAHPMCLVWVLP